MMMNEQRRPEMSSPRQDSTSRPPLKATISLGRNPKIFHSGTFYLMKDPPEESSLTGNTNLMNHYGLEHSYNKFNGKKLRQELSAFITNLPGNIDAPGHHDNSSLRSLIDKPPITGKELLPISSSALSGFRLHAGPLPERFRLMSQTPQRNKKMKKKHKRESNKDGGSSHEGPDYTETHLEDGDHITNINNTIQRAKDTGADGVHDHKKKKSKRTDEEKEKRKKKKEKRRKKEKEKEEKGGGDCIPN